MSLPLILAIILLIGLFLWLRQRQSRPRGRYAASGSRFKNANSGVNGATRRQLLRLVGGNRDVATRLVTTVRERYPGKSEQWCWEKAIYDIQRDRRS